MKHRFSIMLIWFCGLAVSAVAVEMYHTNRTFTPVGIDVKGTPPLVDILYTESGKLTDLVKGTNITVKTNANETYAIEKQAAIPVCHGSAEGAWNAAVAYNNGTPSNYPGKIFDNVGWVRGTRSANGTWGAYLWVLQNRIVFKSSGTNRWVSPSNGVWVAISNVLVGSLGNYQPMADNIVEVGPSFDLATNFPGANAGYEETYRVDITNVFYQLIIPSIWITPQEAYVTVGGPDVQFTVTGTNIPQGVDWSLIPDLSGSDGAVIQSNGAWQAEVTPGNVATNYKVRATSKDNTNFYAEVNLAVIKVEVTNIKFNWDTASSSEDAINIRRDYTNAYDISNGEWVKGVTNIPACYTVNKSATIKARFTVQPAGITSADIWATAIGGGSFGDVLKTNVAFSGGVSDYVTFRVFDTMPDCVQKTASDVWQWKMENVNGSGSAACDLNTSGAHTIYTVLSEPLSPWVNTAGNQKNAWTKALDFDIESASCDGDSTASDALTHITQYLHTGHGLTYDIQWGAANFNIGGTFDLTGYINLIPTNIVNCYDQAGGVNVCARLMGISSEYIFLGWTPSNGKAPFGYILATDLIGVGSCNNPFYPTISSPNNIPLLGTGGVTDLIEPDRSMFGNHAFARYNGQIYDACAGPHLGSETLVQYCTSAIDITSIPERQVSPDGTTWGGNTNGVFEATEIDGDLSPTDVTGIK